MTELLKIAGLSRRFGGLTANADLDLDIARGEVHAVIGPNGAGKSTLVSQLAGELAPSAGQIFFEGHDITSVPTHRRSILGLARTFQVTSIFQGFSALENVAIAAQGQARHSFRFWARARDDAQLNRLAREALERVGLAHRADEPSATLSHGEHRQLEIAIALVAKPKLLLLDEPTAGMGPEESQHMISLLRGLKGQLAMLLIEHDMEVVFAVADRVTVLVDGRVIASGSPDEVRANPAVRQAYLGDIASEPASQGA